MLIRGHKVITCPRPPPRIPGDVCAVRPRVSQYVKLVRQPCYLLRQPSAVVPLFPRRCRPPASGVKGQLCGEWGADGLRGHDGHVLHTQVLTRDPCQGCRTSQGCLLHERQEQMLAQIVRQGCLQVRLHEQREASKVDGLPDKKRTGKKLKNKVK